MGEFGDLKGNKARELPYRCSRQNWGDSSVSELVKKHGSRFDSLGVCRRNNGSNYL